VLCWAQDCKVAVRSGCGLWHWRDRTLIIGVGTPWLWSWHSSCARLIQFDYIGSAQRMIQGGHVACIRTSLAQRRGWVGVC
jgi:hypothetical protein